MIPPDRLQRFPLACELSDDRLRAIASICRERSYGPGQWIFEEGFPAKSVMLLEEGEVALTCRLENGREASVGRAAAGELLGWSALLPPNRLTASALTKSPVRVIEIDAAELRSLCDRDPAVGYVILQHVARTLSQRLESARVQLAVVSGMAAPQPATRGSPE